MIGGKTASLIRTSARLGAMASDATAESVEAVSTWAWELGLVFQMTDDALDLVGTEEAIGKPGGSHIREGTFTLPVPSQRTHQTAPRFAGFSPNRAPTPTRWSKEVISLVRGAGSVDLVLDEALPSLDDGHRGDGDSRRRDGSRCPHHHGDLPGGAGRGGQGVSRLEDGPVWRDPPPGQAKSPQRGLGLHTLGRT